MTKMSSVKNGSGNSEKQQETVVDRIRRIISDDIISGALGPGVRLDEQGLADRFSVSRTPIRETLSQLSALGLVEKRPHKGVIVLVQSHERLLQLFEVMAELEGACARFAAERMTDEERAHLKRMHAAAVVLAKRGDIDQYERHNTEFHRLIYNGTHNSALVETAFEARRRVFHFRRAQFRLENRVRLSQQEHGRIVRAILKGDANAAYDSAKAHILIVREASATLILENASRARVPV